MFFLSREGNFEEKSRILERMDGWMDGRVGLISTRLLFSFWGHLPRVFLPDHLFNKRQLRLYVRALGAACSLRVSFARNENYRIKDHHRASIETLVLQTNFQLSHDDTNESMYV